MLPFIYQLVLYPKACPNALITCPLRTDDSGNEHVTLRQINSNAPDISTPTLKKLLSITTPIPIIQHTTTPIYIKSILILTLPLHLISMNLILYLLPTHLLLVGRQLITRHITHPTTRHIEGLKDYTNHLPIYLIVFVKIVRGLILLLFLIFITVSDIFGKTISMD